MTFAHASKRRNIGRIELIAVATFYIGNALSGIDILKIREINRHTDITQVPQSPDYVRGLLNLRGQVVTVIDLRKIFGLAEKSITEHSRNFIVDVQEERVGILVDRMYNIMLAGADCIEPPPVSFGGLNGRFYQGVFRTAGRAIGILNVEKLLNLTGP